MEQLDPRVPSEKTHIEQLKTSVQSFIDEHESAGKGPARRTAIAALKAVVAANYETLSAAYEAIFAAITHETGKQYLKSKKPHTPKIISLLKAFHRELVLTKQSEEQRRAAEENIEKLRRDAEENAKQLADFKAQQAAEKQKEEPAVPAVAAVPEKKHRASRRKKTVDASQKPDAAAVAVQLERAEEQRRMRQLEDQTNQLEKEAKSRAKMMEEKELRAQKEKAALEAKLLEEQKEKAALAQKEQHARIAQEELERQAKREKAALEDKLREQEQQLKTEKAKLELKLLQEQTDAAAKAKIAAEKALEKANEAFDKGDKKGFDRGFKQGEESERQRGDQEIVKIGTIMNRYPKVRRAVKEMFMLEGGAKDRKATLMIRQFGEDPVEEFAETSQPQAQRTTEPPYNPFSPEEISSTLISNKTQLIGLLVKLRADLIGKHSATSEERKNLAITVAMIEYFICNMKLREHDKSMIDIMTDGYNFMSSIGAGDCAVIQHGISFGEAEKLTLTALTKAQAGDILKKLTHNEYGFNSTEEAIKVFSAYADKDKGITLDSAEKRLRQTFVRAIEAQKIEEWLGTKYAVVKCLVELFERKLTEKDSLEKTASLQNIKVAVLLMIARKDNNKAENILKMLGQLTTLSEEFLQTVQPCIDPNEQVNGKVFGTQEFDIFAALFQKAKFLVISDKNIFGFFNSEGRNPTEKDCIKALLPAKQQAVIAPKSAFHKEAKDSDSSKQARPLAEVKVEQTGDANTFNL